MSPNEIIRQDTVQATAEQAKHPADERVHVSLHRLLRLQHAAAGFSFLPRQPVTSLLSGRHASRLRGRGLNFEEIRAYQAGDDIRMIDWKVTARTREAHSRVFTEERDRPGLLLVDQRVSMFFGTRVCMKSVTAAEAAALSAWRLLKATDRVGALVFNDAQVTHIRPHRSQATVMRILEAIVAMNGALQANLDTPPSSAMLNRILESAAQLAGHDYLVVVISDFDGADDNTRRWLMKLAQHNDVLGVLVHDPSATHLPPSQELVITDGHLQIELPIDRQRVRRELHAFASSRIARVLAWQAEIGVPMLPLSTAEDVVLQVSRLLGNRTGARTGNQRSVIP
jgi:uncharacterized protein (DUF58 family)